MHRAAKTVKKVNMAARNITSPNQVYRLETDRLVLRQFQASDVPRIVEIFADPKVAKWVGDGNPLNQDQAKRWVANATASIEQNGSSAGAIIEKSTSNMIGWGGIVHPNDDDPEIIYGFEVGSWGQGYGKEIATEIVRDGFMSLAIKRLVATVDPENLGSTKILKSLGFELIKSGFDEHGLPTDTYQLHDHI